MTPEALVADCTDRLQPLEQASSIAWWNANTDANDATARARVAADMAYSDALADTDAFAEIRAARTDTNLDPTLARELAVLEMMYAPEQTEAELRRRIVELQTDIESRFARHRGTIDGEEVDDNAILKILRSSNDTARRRAAWEASKTVGAEVAPDLITLVELRNEAARSLGYRDHFALSLANSEYDEARLFATLEEVDAITAAPFRALKHELDEKLAERFACSVDAIGPWHYDDPFFQSPPQIIGVDLDPVLGGADLIALTERTYDGIGLETRALLSRSDLVPRDGKNQHAFCLDVDRSGDVRVLCNNVPNEFWADTMLHEFGHAVHFDGIARDLPWLLRTTANNLTEGVAMRCGRLVRDPEWLTTIAGAPTATISELAPQLEAARRAALLVFARWVLVMTNFERGLYADAHGAHDDRWWDLVERYQLVRRPDGRHEADWAAKIHIAAAPVYYQHYLYGELIASTLAATAGSLVDAPDAGRFLRERVFAPGMSMRWDQLIERASGRPFGTAALAAELAS
jgi:peptidyl-dipeptidase A